MVAVAGAVARLESFAGCVLVGNSCFEPAGVKIYGSFWRFKGSRRGVWVFG